MRATAIIIFLCTLNSLLFATDCSNASTPSRYVFTCKGLIKRSAFTVPFEHYTGPKQCQKIVDYFDYDPTQAQAAAPDFEGSCFLKGQLSKKKSYSASLPDCPCFQDDLKFLAEILTIRKRMRENWQSTEPSTAPDATPDNTGFLLGQKYNALCFELTLPGRLLLKKLGTADMPQYYQDKINVILAKKYTQKLKAKIKARTMKTEENKSETSG